MKKLNGKKFGRLLVLRTAGWRLIGARKHKIMSYVCRCDCGVEKQILGKHLRSGATTSCGCVQKENTSKANLSHGKSDSPEYKSWATMRQRCLNKNNPKYHRYGGRGIKICERWNKFENFLADMGPRPKGRRWSIERNDNDGDYCPENCRWARDLKQANNKSTNHYLTHKGKTLTIAEWAAVLDMDQTTLLMRLRNGMTPEEAIETPVKKINTDNRGKLYTYDGKTMTLFEWAAEKGIAPKTLWARMNDQGKSFEQAINTPLRKIVRNKENLTVKK